MILGRYLAKNVIVATALVVAVLVGIDSFILFFNTVGDIGKHNFSVFKAVAYVFMQLPFDLYQLFPMAGFLGCLIGLGRLASTSELTVMRASGVSMLGITAAVINAAMVMLLVITLLGEFVAPCLSGYAQQMKAVALGDLKHSAGASGVWLRNKNHFVHIGQIESKTKVSQVSSFVFVGNQLSQVSYAPIAKRLKDGHWQMQDLRRTVFSQHGLKQLTILQAPLKVDFDPVVLSLGNKTLDQLTIKGLYDSVHERSKAGLNVEQYQLAFWQRLLQPLATLIMICLGVPFVFGSLREASMGLRVLIGIIVGFSFYVLNQFLGPLAIVYQLSPLVAALIPSVIFILACVTLFRRI